MSSATLHLTRPVAALFHFPPADEPRAVPPPTAHSPFGYAFTISDKTYQWWLQPQVPLTIGFIYATTVLVLNRVNKSRGYKPWAFSQTSLFLLLVTLHNLALAVYSGWTFLGLFKMANTVFPAAFARDGFVGVADALCGAHGKAGLGNEAFYSTSAKQWTSFSNEAVFTSAGLPEPNERGRVWNEGLAFYGWIFYLSKFYEVVDTAIILAKGKRSSTLQTYHHTGAMIAMWAGIRYMAAPIWMFVIVNSFIHTLMYTYYAYTGLGFKVSKVLKQSLTTMQITQFLIGITWTSAHLFFAYTVPVTRTSLLKSATHIYRSSDLVLQLRKLGLRAIGEGAAASALPAKTSGSATYRLVDCMDNEGQVFACWFNIVYLFPLTYLFARFFIKSYIIRSHRVVPGQSSLQQATSDAVRATNFHETSKPLNVVHSTNVDTDNDNGISSPKGTPSKNGKARRRA